MANIYSYMFNGRKTTKQDKCQTNLSLDKPRIWLDFNELIDTDEEGVGCLYLFSQADVVNDSNGKDIELYEGMIVSVYDDDFDSEGKGDALLADGIIILNNLKSYQGVKWLIRLMECGNKKSGNKYVYWMSDLD